MGIDIKLENHCVEVSEKMERGILALLEEAGGELQAQIVRNSRRDTGQTAGSYDYAVNSKGDGAELQVGSNLENAIWEEYGTGEYALKGNGRKGGWVYQDASGEWHRTRGKTAQHPMFKAFTANREKLKQRAAQVMKESVGS